jgi:hypothetical protein
MPQNTRFSRCQNESRKAQNMIGSISAESILIIVNQIGFR